MSALNPEVYYSNEDLQGSYQFVGLEDLVNNFMQNYQGDDTLLGKVDRDKVIYQVKTGIKEFTFSILNQVKAVELELTDTYDIILPFDYVEYVRISWVNKVNGKIMPMSVNRHTPLGIAHLQDNQANILFDNNGEILEGTTILEETNDNLPSVPIETVSSFPAYPNVGYYTRYDIEQQWNLDASKNFNGTFNYNNKRIHFSTESKERIILLEYISDGLELLDVDLKVHKFAEEALYAFVNYNLSKNSIRLPNYEKLNIKKEYDRLYRNARLKLLNIKPQEFIAQLRQGKIWVR